jgi:hypothetical protein
LHRLVALIGETLPWNTPENDIGASHVAQNRHCWIHRHRLCRAETSFRIFHSSVHDAPSLQHDFAVRRHVAACHEENSLVLRYPARLVVAQLPMPSPAEYEQQPPPEVDGLQAPPKLPETSQEQTLTCRRGHETAFSARPSTKSWGLSRIGVSSIPPQLFGTV